MWVLSHNGPGGTGATPGGDALVLPVLVIGAVLIGAGVVMIKFPQIYTYFHFQNKYESGESDHLSPAERQLPASVATGRAYVIGLAGIGFGVLSLLCALVLLVV